MMHSPRMPESEYGDSERTNIEVVKKYKLKPFKGLSLPSMAPDQASEMNISDPTRFPPD